MTWDKFREVIVRFDTKSVENFSPEQLDTLYPELSHLQATSRDEEVFALAQLPNGPDRLRGYRAKMPAGLDWHNARNEVTQIILWLEANKDEK